MTVEAILQKLERLRRPCSVATVGGFRPPEDPLTSWFGGNFVSPPDVPWPANRNGPMVPLLQAVATDVPVWPQHLRDYSVVQVFIDRITLPVDTPVEQGDSWVLRCYADTPSLVRATDPAPHLRPFPVRWRRVEGDSPSWEELDGLLERTEISALAAEMERYFSDFGSVFGTKLGGWPSYVQGGALPGLDFVLQIASEPKSGWVWGDAGNGYVFRNDRGSWFLHWDCY